VKRYRWACLFAALSMIGCSVAIARDATAPKWPDTPLARTQALALLQTLNADLLSHDSATLTLEHWCGAHHMASPARVIAQRMRGDDKPLPPEWRAQLAIDANELVKYRRVQLTCGDHVLSEADNWYLPNRLTAAMNRQLDSSDVPFGKVVQLLHFRRKTLSADLLWSPLPAGWELHRTQMQPAAGVVVMPQLLLQHRAVLFAGDGRPFSALVETYTDQVLAF
jgi:chorismate-pyruvate lyase